MFQNCPTSCWIKFISSEISVFIKRHYPFPLSRIMLSGFFAVDVLYLFNFFLRFVAQEVCTACSRTSYKIVPLTNLNKYLHNDTSETEVNTNVSANNSSEKVYKKHCDFR